MSDPQDAPAEAPRLESPVTLNGWDPADEDCRVLLDKQEYNAILERLQAAEAEVELLQRALSAARDELSHWGWGDFHYGSAGHQEQRVVDALAAIDAVLHPEERSNREEPA